VSTEHTHQEWAVRVHCLMSGVPGPHVLECSDNGLALLRLEWWRTHRPEARPELLVRDVVVTVHEWKGAA
jgi:hypothetical protein